MEETLKWEEIGGFKREIKLANSMKNVDVVLTREVPNQNCDPDGDGIAKKVTLSQSFVNLTVGACAHLVADDQGSKVDALDGGIHAPTFDPGGEFEAGELIKDDEEDVDEENKEKARTESMCKVVKEVWNAEEKSTVERADIKLERFCKFEPLFELGLANLVVSDKRPNREEASGDCKLGEF